MSISMSIKSSREKRKAEWLSESLRKQEQAQLSKTVKKALAKGPGERSAEEKALLEMHKLLAAQVRMSMETKERRKKVKAEHMSEVEDPPDVMEAKLQELAPRIRTSPLVILHVGAGLSTAAGIPDFRGPQGVWTLQKKGQTVAMRMRYEDSVPTKAHMALAAMVRGGLVSHVVSQNVDGLLLRAGVPPNRLSELHGCIYTERCSSCGHAYTRSYDVTAANGSTFRRHATGRLCDTSDHLTSASKATSAAGSKQKEDAPKLLQRANDGQTNPDEHFNKDELRMAERASSEADVDPCGPSMCGGSLQDTITHFGERLHEETLRTAREASEEADLAVVAGTSLKVPPASTLPFLSKNRILVRVIIRDVQTKKLA